MPTPSRRPRRETESPADYYFAHIPAPLDEIANALRKLVRETLPDAEERVYFCVPNYHVCYIDDHKKHVNLGFLLGAHIPDPKGVLEGTGKSLRHVKIRSVADIKPALLKPLLRASWKLHEARPAAPKKPAKPRKPRA